MILDRLKAIDLLDRGVFHSAVVTPASALYDSWILLLVSSSGERKALTRARKSGSKIYKSADAALADARALGFKIINVEFDTNKDAA